MIFLLQLPTAPRLYPIKKTVCVYFVDGWWEEMNVFYSVKDHRQERKISIEGIRNKEVLPILKDYSTISKSKFSVDSIHLRLGGRDYCLHVIDDRWVQIP